MASFMQRVRAGALSSMPRFRLYCLLVNVSITHTRTHGPNKTMLRIVARTFAAERQIDPSSVTRPYHTCSAERFLLRSALQYQRCQQR